MITSLVTGGAGFIGSHLVDELISLGHKVVVIDDLSGGFKKNLNKNAMFYKVSIQNYKKLAKIFDSHQFDYVYHTAAYAAEGLSHYIRRYNYNNNLIGSINLINLSIIFNIKRFIFTSSIAVYGSAQTPMTENTIPSPEDPYGISKYAVELDLKSAHKLFGLNYTIFRPHNVYGERQNISDKYRNVIGIFMNKIIKNEDILIFGDGKQSRAFTYIKDIIPSIACCVNIAKSKNQTYNIGADKPYTLQKLAKIVLQAFDSKSKIIHVQARDEVKHAFSDHSKSKNTFKNITQTKLVDGIKIMSTWVKKHKIKPTIKFKNIEIIDKLPPSWQ